MVPDWRLPQRPALRRKFLRGFTQSVPEWRGAGAAQDLFWARNGIYRGLRALGIGSGATVLVPAFICRSVPEAIAATGATIEFYRVDVHARADVDDLRSRIHDGVRAVLVVHYFGSLQPAVADLRELCDQLGLLLVEDCAHLVTSGSRPGLPGTFGHLGVFSWRKFLPAYDGGGLVLDSGLSVREIPGLARRASIELRAVKHLLEQGLAAAKGGTRSSSRRLSPGCADETALSASAGRASVAGIPRRQAVIDPNSDRFDGNLARLPMSLASKWIFEHTDMDAVIAARRANWCRVHEAVTEASGMRPLADGLGDSVGPWSYALRFPSTVQAHRRLREMGVPAANWAGVRPPSLPTDAFPESEELYQNLVFLPVHQDLEADDLAFMADAMRQIAKSTRGDP